MCTASAIDEAHQKLVLAIEASKGFDEVVAAHESFLATATSNCFLRTPELHQKLEVVLHIALSFCRLRFEITPGAALNSAAAGAVDGAGAGAATRGSAGVAAGRGNPFGSAAGVGDNSAASGWIAAQAPRKANQAIAAQNAEMYRLHMEFSFTVRSILKMMASMHRQGMHTHLSQLLLRLDYNGYFSGEMD